MDNIGEQQGRRVAGQGQLHGQPGGEWAPVDHPAGVVPAAPFAEPPAQRAAVANPYAAPPAPYGAPPAPSAPYGAPPAPSAPLGQQLPRQVPQHAAHPMPAPQRAPQHAAQPVAQVPSPALAPAPTPVLTQVPAPAPAPVATPAPVPPAQRVPAGGPVGHPKPEVSQADLDLKSVLEVMLAVGASDLHLSAGSPPLARVDGELGTLDGFGELNPNGIQRALYAILTQRQRERFEADLELDLAYALPGRARFRVNLYRQREAMGAAFRRIPYEIKSLEDLGMPPVVSHFAGLSRGLVLVTGPTGSGKSTTLAALVDLANRTRHDHIMTVEDPIEFLHTHKGCLVNQREVGGDTHSFSNALRHALRQDPDILLVGEMRDLETISVALTAAETGHLVFATLHTQDAAQTIDRIVDVFPPHQQQQVRTQLAGTLQGVVCQTLCRRAEGRGRAAATEILVATPAVRNMIREGKTHQVYSTLQAGAQHGMHTLDQHLADLTRRGIITQAAALEVCHHHEDFMRLIGAR